MSSLKHLLLAEELLAHFSCMHRALEEDGVYVVALHVHTLGGKDHFDRSVLYKQTTSDTAAAREVFASPAAASTDRTNPSTTGTVLYLTPKSDTPAGRYVMTLVGTAGSTQKAVLVALTVKVTGDFAMLASPTTVTRTSPGTSNYVINIGTSLPVRPTVSYSVDGLPVAATAKFNVNDTDKSPTLSVTTAAQTPNGTYNLTVTGRSGSVVKQIQVQLVVNQNPVGFTTSADNDTISIPRGQTRQIILTIRPSGGFTGAIATGLSNLPSGVTLVSISDAAGIVNQPVSIVITLSAAASAPVTSAAVAVNITSSSGPYVSTIKVNVNVI